jgi:hypothetical protein
MEPPMPLSFRNAIALALLTSVLGLGLVPAKAADWNRRGWVHVIVGTLFLIVCLFRTFKGHFKPDQHLGFEFAAWYWHFVDVVWLFLFCCIYVWGNWGGAME